MSDWRDEYYQLIDDCEARDSKLSAWDVDFLASIRKRLDGNGTLTPKQTEKLDEIWEKVTKNG